LKSTLNNLLPLEWSLLLPASATLVVIAGENMQDYYLRCVEIIQIFLRIRQYSAYYRPFAYVQKTCSHIALFLFDLSQGAGYIRVAA
jgi:hypothetical protein